MSHKAFIFNYQLFDTLLHQKLVDSLKQNNSEKLIEFIKTNLEEIKDPDEGLPLKRSWQITMEIDDIQGYADIALTKFYNPAEDIGLNYEWSSIVEILNAEFSLDADRLILGRQICFANCCFNPGRIGSYFQSFDDTQWGLKMIRGCLKQKPELAVLENLATTLQHAVNTQQGLYVTF